MPLIHSAIKSSLILVSSILILFSCKSSQSSLVTTEASAPVIDHSKCIFLGDAYEPKARLAAGSHKGECVETRYARSVVELPGSSTTIRIANFTHNKEFWIAEIPRYGVKNLIYQIEVFPAFENQPKDWELAGHSQVRLQFSPDNPVLLTHQMDPTKAATLTDIVISAEALGEVGYSYNIFNGMKLKHVGGPFSLKFENDSDFNIVYRIVSLDDRYDWMINIQKHKVTQFPLTLSDEDKQKILPSFLDISMKNRLDNPYHTIKINCANQIFLTFDNALTYTSFRKPREDRYGLQESYPIGSYKSLVPRGLLKVDKSTETGYEMLPNLGDDPSAKSPK